jgi:hypothetical protein
VRGREEQLPLSGKEPWQMTADEYLAHVGIITGAARIQQVHNQHSVLVYDAVQSGCDVPLEVLREYPTAARQRHKS